jgi:hypothetical protein
MVHLGIWRILPARFCVRVSSGRMAFWVGRGHLGNRGYEAVVGCQVYEMTNGNFKLGYPLMR